MASSSSPTTKKRLNYFQPTPKMSSRPGQLRLPDARSPPLTTSLNSNAPQYPSQHKHLLSTKETNLRLKIKSALTPDARTRLTVKPVGARAAAPNSRLEAPAPAVRAMDRAITPSDSEGSLAETLVTASRGGLGDGVEELGETEAVLVTVRYVRLSDVELD